MKILRLDEVEGVPVFGTLVWKPVRKTLGVTAFGINAYTAANAGDEVVEDHDETPLGHEEIYAVVSGHATFTVDGEEIDAPAGTLVFLDDPKERRAARAVEPGTTVLAIGGMPGTHEVSAWEYIFPSLPARNAEDWDTARHVLEDAIAESDHPSIHYHLACVEARAGNRERALDELNAAVERRPRLLAPMREEEDFASIRDDPRFPA
ncbi:MAG: TPR end-of-group domain-containing protein [Gaiellaceae bacterium]